VDEFVTVADITGIGGFENLRVLLSLHLNCYAEGFAQAMVDQCGADCAIGWDEEGGSIPIFGVRVYSKVFWDELCHNGNSMETQSAVPLSWQPTTRRWRARIPRGISITYSAPSLGVDVSILLDMGNDGRLVG